MRWRGPPDLAAQTPLPHAQRPCHSINHQAGYPLEVPVAQFPLRPGVPPGWFPFSVVRDFYAHPGLLHKGFRLAISRFFSHPQTVHSSAQVIPLLARILHKKSTGDREPCNFRAWPATLRSRARWAEAGAQTGGEHARPAEAGRATRRAGMRADRFANRREAHGRPAGPGPGTRRACTGCGRSSRGGGSGRRNG